MRVSQTNNTQRGEYFNVSDFLLLLCLMNTMYMMYMNIDGGMKS